MRTTLLLAAPVIVAFICAGCSTSPGSRPSASVTPSAAAAPAPSPTFTPISENPSAAAASAFPSLPPGPICQAYALSLAVWQQTGADGTATGATFRRFARELHAESVLATHDQPLGSDLQWASLAVRQALAKEHAGGNVNTAVLAGVLENVKLDCNQV